MLCKFIFLKYPSNCGKIIITLLILEKMGFSGFMKKLFISLFVLFGAANCSFAVNIPSAMKETMAQNYGMPSLLQLIISMVLVIGLIYVTGWIYTKLNIVNRKKIGKIASDNGDCSRFTVLQSMPLGQQRHIYTIEMNGKILLVGSTPSHINLIKEFDKENMPASMEKEIFYKSEEKETYSDSSGKSIDIDELYKKYKN